MKRNNVIWLTAAIWPAVVLPVSLGYASEVSYLETFGATPYPWVSTTEHARFTDWLNGDSSTALSNGVLRTWGTYAPYKPANPLANLKSIVMKRSGEIWPERDLELRADVLRLGGAGAYAALGWQQEGLYCTRWATASSKAPRTSPW